MHSLIADNVACLRQGQYLLSMLDDATLTRPCAECFGSTIGTHLRHNADHYACFLDGYAGGAVDYDARSRGRDIEKSVQAATELWKALTERFEAVPASVLDQPLRIRLDAGKNGEWSDSTVRRELQFLISHTIHHYALIATIARLHGMNELPPDFGVAPSTLKYQARA